MALGAIMVVAAPAAASDEIGAKVDDLVTAHGVLTED
jgi:hypothetical protein